MLNSYIIIALFCVCAIPVQAQNNCDDTLKILFTGDVLLDRGVRKRISDIGIDSLMSGVRPLFMQHDAVVINLECPLSERKSFVNKQIVFRADTILAQGLRRNGVTHAALANNHSMDRGIGGLDDTRSCLNNAGIETMGYGSKAERMEPIIIQKGDLKVAIFNDNTFPIENWMRASHSKNIQNITADSLAVRIRHYHAENPDIPIVAFLHWGTEFSLKPTFGQKHDAAILAAAGASAIIGHHPHVVQPVEYLGQVPVCFSLGNFIFDQTKPNTTTGMAVSLSLTHGGAIAVRTCRVEIENCQPKGFCSLQKK